MDTGITSLISENKRPALLFDDLICPVCGNLLELKSQYDPIKQHRIYINYHCNKCANNFPIYHDSNNEMTPLYDVKILKDFFNTYIEDS